MFLCILEGIESNWELYFREFIEFERNLPTMLNTNLNLEKRILKRFVLPPYLKGPWGPTNPSPTSTTQTDLQTDFQRRWLKLTSSPRLLLGTNPILFFLHLRFRSLLGRLRRYEMYNGVIHS